MIWRALPHILYAVFREAALPQQHPLTIDRRVSGNRAIGLTGRRSEHDPASKRHLLGSAVRYQPLLNLFLVHKAQTRWRNQWKHTAG